MGSAQDLSRRMPIGARITASIENGPKGRPTITVVEVDDPGDLVCEGPYVSQDYYAGTRIKVTYSAGSPAYYGFQRFNTSPRTLLHMEESVTEQDSAYMRGYLILGGEGVDITARVNRSGLDVTDWIPQQVTWPGGGACWFRYGTVDVQTTETVLLESTTFEGYGRKRTFSAPWGEDLSASFSAGELCDAGLSAYGWGTAGCWYARAATMRSWMIGGAGGVPLYISSEAPPGPGWFSVSASARPGSEGAVAVRVVPTRP